MNTNSKVNVLGYQEVLEDGFNRFLKDSSIDKPSSIERINEHGLENDYWGLDSKTFEKCNQELHDNFFSQLSIITKEIIVGPIDELMKHIAYNTITGVYFEDVGYDRSSYPLKTNIHLKLGHFKTMEELLCSWHVNYTTATFISGAGLATDNLKEKLDVDIQSAIDSQTMRYIEDIFSNYITDESTLETISMELTDVRDCYFENAFSFCHCCEVVEYIGDMTIEEFFHRTEIPIHALMLDDIIKRGYSTPLCLDGNDEH